MKLRLQGNSLRLRVTRPELEDLLASGRIAETTRLSSGPESTLTYALVCLDCAKVEVQFGGGEIAVVLPWPVARLWSSETEVGIRASVNTGETELAVLVEKDFACLHGSEAENAGTFPNRKMQERG